MYVFKVIEIEQIIFSYLDYGIDFNRLRQVSKNYKDLINNNDIYTKLVKFDKWHLLDIEDKFIRACQTNIFVAKYLFYKNKMINIHSQNEHAFRCSCGTGYLDIACWLWSLDGKINLHAVNECAFRWSCENGHLDVAKWLWSLDGKIDLHVNKERIFRWSCENGQLDVVSWLWSLDGKIDLHASDEYAFYWSFVNSKFDVACWLWDLDGKINLDIIEKRYRLRIMEWLESIGKKI